MFGKLAPGLEKTLFPAGGPTYVAMEGLTTVAVVLLLLIAGIEINLSSVWRQRRTTFLVSILGNIIPFAAGFLAAYYAPDYFGLGPGGDPLVFAFFVGTALSFSALPVIARLLMDLGLLKSDLGALVMSSAALNDLIGLIIFSMVIGMVATGHANGINPETTIVVTLLFTLFMLTIMRHVFHRLLPWLERRTVWPGGVLGFVFACTMIGAAATEWLGVHAIFGAFLVGIAVGDTQHLSARTKDAISQFATHIFAPLFFANIGLRIDFASNFDGGLVLVVFALASGGKILGSMIGTRLSGHNIRESLAVGMGMNARGAMEIILGLLALEYGLIDERLFVAFVIMAIGTTMLSGPMMEYFIREKKPLTLASLIQPEGFVPDLAGATPKEVIHELAEHASFISDIETERIRKAVWDREEIMGTAIGGGIAVPHARMLEISTPIVIAGKSKGIDFNAIDGNPVKLIFMILTPQREMKTQLQILADIARVFTKEHIREETLNAADYDSFMAAVRKADTPAS